MAHTYRSKISDHDDNSVNIDEDDGRRFHDLGNGARRSAKQDPESDFFAVFADFNPTGTLNGYSILDNPDSYDSTEDEDDIEEAYPCDQE